MKALTKFLMLTTCAIALAPLNAVAKDGESSGKPNIVMIMADDLAPYDVSAYHRGLGAVTTTNIDQHRRRRH